MSYFTEHFWGDKHHGFDVLYHNMKHGQISTKELADFVRERAAIEESYAKAMVKLSKMATNGTQLGTFAPLWEVFRISSDKLALCHLELMKKLHELIKDISRYSEEQGRVHKKSKEEVAGTLEAVQLLQGVAQLLPKCRDSYHSKCHEYERLRREGTSQKDIDKAELKSRKAGEALRRAVEKYNTARAEFEQRMLDSAMRFQEVEEAHLRHMKGLIGSYSHSVEDTHVQIGQVHEEFKQNVQNIGTEALLRRFAESKGTGRERPGALDFEAYRQAPAQEGPRRSRSKAFRIPGLSRRERERDTAESPDPDLGCPEVDEDGFSVRPAPERAELDNPGCSSSDSDYDEEEPRKFRVLIKPLQPQEPAQATEEQLRATVGHLSLGPALGGTGRRLAGRQVTSLTPSDPEGTLPGGDSGGRGLPAAQLNSGPVKPPQDPQDPRDPRDPPDSAALFGPPLESAFEEFPAPRSCSSPSSSSSSSSCSPENVPDSGLDSPSHPQPGPSPDSRPWTPQGDPKNPSWTPHAEPPDPKNSSRPWTPQGDPKNPSWTPQGDPKNPSRPWTPQGDPKNPSRPWTPQGDPKNPSWTPQAEPPDPKNPSWIPQGDPKNPSRTPQPDPKNPSRPWTPQPDPPNPSRTPQAEPPDPKNPSWIPQGDPKNSSWTPEPDPKNPSRTPQGDPKNPSRPWTPQPDPKNPSWTPQGDPKNPSRPWTPQPDPKNPSRTPHAEPPDPSWTPQPDPKNSSRPWTPQPDPKNPSRTPQAEPPDPKNLSWTPQPDPKNPSRPWTPQGDPPDPPNFAPFGAAEGLWGVSGVSGVSGVAPPRSRSRCPTDPPPSPSPDPFGDPPVWGEPPPAPSSRSSSSSSPAPPSGRGSCSPSPSPWGCPGPGSGEGGAAGEAQPEPEPPWPSAAPRDVPVVAPPRRSRSRRAGPGSNSDLSRSLSPSPSWSCGPSHSAPASLSERGFFSAAPPALGLSRGPSPVVLGSQDALPVATAFTEYVHAYFKGRDADSCLVKVTGELTMSFPAGIVRVFGASAAPPVLSFRLLNAAGIEQFLPNSELLYSDPSQSDPSTKDFWLNMGALSAQLQRQAEQSPGAPYYNVVLLKYQFSRLGPGSAPLRLAVSWDCSPGCTRVTVEYGYNGAALALPAPLANVTVLLPLEEPLGNLRLQPAATWNLEEKRLLWKLLDVPGAPGQAGSGRLSASWEPLGGRSKPSPVAAQFSGEGSTLSGLELQLPGAAYRVSLLKKRFATGIYLAGS